MIATFTLASQLDYAKLFGFYEGIGYQPYLTTYLLTVVGIRTREFSVQVRDRDHYNINHQLVRQGWQFATLNQAVKLTSCKVH